MNSSDSNFAPQDNRHNERELLHTILEHSPFLTAFVDSDLRFRYVNQRYAEFHGQSRESILRRTVPELLGSQGEPLLSYWKKALQGERTHIQTQLANHGGELRWLDTTQIPALDKNGNVVGFYSFLEDVTESHERERFMKLVFQHTPAFILLIDKDLNFRFANEAILEALGLSADEVIGKPVRDIFNGSTDAVTERHLHLALKGEKRIYENTLITKNRPPLDVLVHLVPETNSHGETTGVLAFVVDISELKITRQKLQQNELRFQAAMDGSSVGIVEFENGRPDWMFTAHVENLLGFSDGDFQNSRKRVRARIHPNDLETYELSRQQEAHGQGTKIEIRLQNKSGNYRWFSMITRAIDDTDGNSSKIIGTIADIDDLKKAQLDAAEGIKRRDEFLAMLSHELRNPMAAITFSLDCLHESEPFSENGARLVDIITRQTGQISKLLQALLDVSRVTQNRIVFDLVVHDLNQSIQEIVDSIRPAILKKQQRLTIIQSPQPASVEGDVARLKQAMANLLDNASKYTPEGGQIWLETSHRDQDVIFSVRDTGFGIQSSTLENIFELFFQAEQPLHRKSGGIGVGLFLVDQIVRSHSGTVAAFSEGPGRGSQFTISLPRSDEPIGGETPNVPIRFPGHRLLLVEDNSDARTTLSQLLKQRGFEVSEFTDGESAVNELPSLQFDVAIIDIGLPGKNGLELATKIRESRHLKNSVLIAMTGYNQMTDRQLATAAGFDTHLVKPTNFAVLCETIAMQLNKSSGRQKE
jgi:two-component system CheB/CheR fusion protein